MVLLDVNALVALVWDSHVHHATMRSWFRDQAGGGWATCPITDVHLLVVARHAGARLVTFDAGLARLGGDDVELLRAL